MSSYPFASGPTASTPRPSDLQPQAAGGRTTATPTGIAHVAPGSNGPAAIIPELLTSKQAAELCGIAERTLWSWSRSGLAPAPLKIGLGTRPAVRFKRSEYMAWIQAGCPRVDRGQR